MYRAHYIVFCFLEGIYTQLKIKIFGNDSECVQIVGFECDPTSIFTSIKYFLSFAVGNICHILCFTRLQKNKEKDYK